MSEEYFDYLVLLEKSLAAFYENLKKKAPYEKIRSVLEFMESHSEQHAERIADLEAEYSRPVLDKKIILDVQNNLNSEVKDRVENESNLITVLNVLADAEEGLGIMYKQLAGHLLKISEYYGKISGEIEEIAREEYNHRDLLLADRDALKKK